jgi:hypothetical protein
MKRLLKTIAMLLLFPLIQNSAWGQVAGKPSLTIEGSIALGTAATVSGLGVTGKISNTNNTICMIKRIDVQWGKVDTSNNNTFTAYSNFFNMTKFTIQPSVVMQNLNWDYSTSSQASTLFNNSGYSLGANEKFAAKLTVVYAYYVSGNPIPLEDEKVRVVIKP